MKYLYILILTSNLIYSHSSNYHYNFVESSNYRIVGDINEDGVINIQDVVLLINLILNNEYNNLADLNSDNISNVLDVVQIINVILYSQEIQECAEIDYSTEGILTNISQQIFNDDESVNNFSIYSWTSDDSDRILTGNGIPNHEVGTFPNPNCPSAISEQNINHTFSLFPQVVFQQGQAVGGPGGVIAYALNSVKFDPGTAGRCNDDGVCSLAQGQGQWSIEALGHETFDFGDDMNHAHVQPTGQYHYHGMPDLLVDFLNEGEDMTLVGWASDGFPIYAEYGYAESCDASSEIVSLQPSWKLKDNPDPNRPEILTQLSGGPGGGQNNLNIPIPMGAFTQDFEYVDNYGDLDECNGRIGVTPEFPDGIYYYMVTNEFPFFSRCLKGDFSSGNGGTGGGPGGGTGGGPGGGNIQNCDVVPQGMPCCGDGICGGPENINNCPEDCN